MSPRLATLLVFALCAAVLSACGGGQEQANAPTDSGSLWGRHQGVRPPLTAEEVQALVSLVANTRGLSEKRSIPVERVGGDHVANMLHGRCAKSERKVAAREQLRLLVALNMAPAAVTQAPMDLSCGGSLLQKELVGYYDPDAKKVYFRGSGDMTPRQEFHERFTLAHEVQHALQDQHFGLPDLEKMSDYDALLAYKALSEGDATVTAIAYIGAAEGIPLSRMLRRTADVELMRYAAKQGQSKAMAESLPFIRQRLEFPYLEGTGFASALVRGGQFALVDKAFRAPPTTTEQVLHARKYVAGEQPDVLESPPMPAGFKELSSAPLGEFQTHLVLERCVTRAVARRASTGWGGDLLTLAKRADGALAVLWNTAWDSQRDALQFAEAIQANPECWPKSESDELRVAKGHTALTSGKRVAFVRGLPSAAARNTARRMLTTKLTRAPAKPLGNFRIPKLRPVPTRRPGLVKGSIYRSDWLGVQAHIPKGVGHEVQADSEELDSLELSVERRGTLLGMVGVYDRIATSAFDQLLVKNVYRGLATVIEAPLVNLKAGKVTTTLGDGKEWVAQVAGTTVQTRVVMVPICQGTGSLVFVHVYFDSYAHTVLDGWMKSFRWLRKKSPPICYALNPV